MTAARHAVLAAALRHPDAWRRYRASALLEAAHWLQGGDREAARDALGWEARYRAMERTQERERVDA